MEQIQTFCGINYRKNKKRRDKIKELRNKISEFQKEKANDKKIVEKKSKHDDYDDQDYSDDFDSDSDNECGVEKSNRIYETNKDYNGSICHHFFMTAHRTTCKWCHKDLNDESIGSFSLDKNSEFYKLPKEIQEKRRHIHVWKKESEISNKFVCISAIYDPEETKKIRDKHKTDSITISSPCGAIYYESTVLSV